MEKGEYEKIIKYVFVGAGLFLSTIIGVGFILTPMTADIKIFMASANQATYISKNLLIGSYKVWELKSVFSRMLMYAIYKTAVLFVPFSSYSFEICSKFIYMLLILLISWRCMKYLFWGLAKSQIFLGTVFVSASVMAMHTHCHLQVEMTSALLIFLAFSLYINAITTNRRVFLKLFLSGILIGSVFYFKSVLLLLSVSVVAGVCIWNIKNETPFSVKRMMIVVLGSITILVLNMVIILLVNPDEIQDMVYASVFQQTLFSVESISIRRIMLRFIGSFFKSAKLIPIIMIGAIAFAYNIIKNIFYKKWSLLFFHVILWLMPILFVVLCNKYFAYHFVVFLYPSMIEIYFIIQEKNVLGKSLTVIAVLSGTIIYLKYMSIFSANVKSYIDYNLEAYRTRDLCLSQIDFDITENVMYLDDGMGAYYLGNQSHLKYFFPLPLQRLEGGSADLDCYSASLTQALSYEGKYISVYESWFFAGKNQIIKDKIASEYQWVGSYIRFSPPSSLSSSDISVQYFDLYERNEQGNEALY